MHAGIAIEVTRHSWENNIRHTQENSKKKKRKTGYPRQDKRDAAFPFLIIVAIAVCLLVTNKIIFYVVYLVESHK